MQFIVSIVSSLCLHNGNCSCKVKGEKKKRITKEKKNEKLRQALEDLTDFGIFYPSENAITGETGSFLR